MCIPACRLMTWKNIILSLVLLGNLSGPWRYSFFCQRVFALESYVNYFKELKKVLFCEVPFIASDWVNIAGEVDGGNRAAPPA